MATSPDIRAAVRAEMDSRQYTIAEVARLSGVPRPNLSGWLAGKTDLRVTSAEQVMQVLGLDVKPVRS